MTELADVGDSNSPDISRKGSNPFIRTQADIFMYNVPKAKV